MVSLQRGPINAPIVLLEDCFCSEPFAAGFAFVWFLHSVDKQLHLEDDFCFEPSAAGVTFVWFLFSVEQQVCLEYGFCFEPFAAGVTFMSFSPVWTNRCALSMARII